MHLGPKREPNNSTTNNQHNKYLPGGSDNFFLIDNIKDMLIKMGIVPHKKYSKLTNCMLTAKDIVC